MNCIIRITPYGWEYEADQRHSELIIQGMGMDSGKAVKTPGEEIPNWRLEEEDQLLTAAQATTYRMVAARANYLATDRLDIQFAVKECCRGMANPTIGSWNMMKRLARYLNGETQNGMGIPMAGTGTYKCL